METLAQKWVVRDVNMGCDMQQPMNIKHLKQNIISTAQNQLVPETVRWQGHCDAL